MEFDNKVNNILTWILLFGAIMAIFIHEMVEEPVVIHNETVKEVIIKEMYGNATYWKEYSVELENRNDKLVEEKRLIKIELDSIKLTREIKINKSKETEIIYEYSQNCTPQIRQIKLYKELYTNCISMNSTNLCTNLSDSLNNCELKINKTLEVLQ